MVQHLFNVFVKQQWSCSETVLLLILTYWVLCGGFVYQLYVRVYRVTILVYIFVATNCCASSH